MPLNNPITSALLADPEIFQQNRLPFHAHFTDQTSLELPLTVSLDGEWNFLLCGKPDCTLLRTGTP